MKKRVLSIFLVAFIILNLSLMLAQGNESQTQKAYNCLEEKVEGNCDSLTLEQQIFSLLAIGQCADEILDDSNYISNTKQKAQAVLALSRAGKDTTDAEEWLLDQRKVPANMDWLLQIDSTEESTCTIESDAFSGSSSVTINSDKTLTLSGSTLCFELYGDDYWLRISPDCYSEEFTISCDKSFLTNLFYKKEGLTIYVSGATHTASAGGTTTEQVNSFCFASDKDSDSCDYEATLWSALVLNFRGEEVFSYLPYLITMKDESDNLKYLPESFLYSLTGDFRGELLSTILPVSNNKYYDTAVAFLPFQGETPDEKADAIEWLSEVQGNDGCWNGGNIRDTAFVLYSLWPRALAITGDEGPDCENSGYYCMSRLTCSDAGGDALEEYSGCFGADICCTESRPLENCVDQGGEVCGSGETCSISTTEALDTSECCLGYCSTPSEQTECQLYADGICRTSCYSDEDQSDYNCASGQVCCVAKTTETKSYWWIWVLLVLIVLVALGIVFRDKLRQLWFKIKSKFGKGKGKPSAPSQGPKFPPLRPGVPPQTPMPRRIIPSAQKRPIRKPSQKGRGDIDDVLKKLKEMGK